MLTPVPLREQSLSPKRGPGLPQLPAFQAHSSFSNHPMKLAYALPVLPVPELLQLQVYSPQFGV